MNIRNVRALAELVRDMRLSSLEIEEDGTRIRIEGCREVAAAPAAAPAAAVQEIAVTAAAPAAPAASADAGVDFNAIHTVESPMVGVFYSSPDPEGEPYVRVGSKVKKGDVLCIVEAMKLMNEITSDRDGEIVDVCVGNGDVVEYGQTLFKIF